MLHGLKIYSALTLSSLTKPQFFNNLNSPINSTANAINAPIKISIQADEKKTGRVIEF